jgi:hypothetical protein
VHSFLVLDGVPLRSQSGGSGHLPLSVASCDNSIHVWDVETGQAMSNLQQFKPEAASTFSLGIGAGAGSKAPQPAVKAVPE